MNKTERLILENQRAIMNYLQTKFLGGPLIEQLEKTKEALAPKENKISYAKSLEESSLLHNKEKVDGS